MTELVRPGTRRILISIDSTCLTPVLNDTFFPDQNYQIHHLNLAHSSDLWQSQLRSKPYLAGRQHEQKHARIKDFDLTAYPRGDSKLKGAINWDGDLDMMRTN